MKIERVELFVVRLPLKNAYETSGARETHMTRVLCRVESEGAVQEVQVEERDPEAEASEAARDDVQRRVVPAKRRHRVSFAGRG